MTSVEWMITAKTWKLCQPEAFIFLNHLHIHVLTPAYCVGGTLPVLLCLFLPFLPALVGMIVRSQLVATDRARIVLILSNQRFRGKFHISIRGKVSWKQRGLNGMRPREILPAMVWGKEDGTYACRATLASHRLLPSSPGKWSTQHLYRASPGFLLRLSWWGDLPRLPC